MRDTRRFCIGMLSRWDGFFGWCIHDGFGDLAWRTVHSLGCVWMTKYWYGRSGVRCSVVWGIAGWGDAAWWGGVWCGGGHRWNGRRGVVRRSMERWCVVQLRKGACSFKRGGEWADKPGISWAQSGEKMTDWELVGKKFAMRVEGDFSWCVFASLQRVF